MANGARIDEFGDPMPQTTMLGLAMWTHRREKKVSMRSAAKEAGVSAPTWARVEHGKAPDVYNFFRICGWLGIRTPTLHLLDLEPAKQ